MSRDYVLSSIYLSPAPLYHVAPLTYAALTIRNGGTVVVMERFDRDGMDTAPFLPRRNLR
jgi:hypothetical protein